MKVLWYVNIIMPAVAQAMDWKTPNTGGWLTGAAEGLRDTDIRLSIMTVSNLVSEKKIIESEDIAYILIPPKHFKAQFANTLQELRPDLVHIFGTEYHYNTSLIHLCSESGVKHVVSLQGIMYQIAKHYTDGLPKKYERINPIIKLMRKLYYADSIALEKKRFADQGVLEVEALKKADAVIGRTAWDKRSALAVNPNLAYYHVNENLRDAFYTGEGWRYEACTPHTIFISQSFYPIKGFHMLLAAMPELIRRYPDLKVVVGGQKPYTMHNRFLDKIVDYFFEYQQYTKKLIKQNHLQPYIHYTGSLDAGQMKAEFLKCNVFLSCSTIENSPNSVGEAMLLGVPVVASNVGGTESMLTDGQDGVLYDFYDSDAMVKGISAIFDHPETAEKMSSSARRHAAATHDREANTAALIGVYRSIQESET